MLELRAHNLQKSYHQTTVVEDVSLYIQYAEIVGLLGPNGAGKTTCFTLLVGQIQADSGHITLGDQDITHLPIHQRATLGIGYLPQEASIFRGLSVQDNIMAILENRPELNRSQRQQRLDALLNEFQMTQRRHHKGHTLSGGERRRVEIARALALETRFLLLDEPFAGIDPLSIEDIKSIIKQLQKRGVAVLITDHNVRDTLAICQRAYILHDGMILAEGSPNDLMNNATVKNAYLGNTFTQDIFQS